MPNPTEISLLNYNLEAKACNELLTAMLNHSDFDYVTVDELRRYSELSQFTFDELRTAVYELCKRGFLHVVLGDRIDKNCRFVNDVLHIRESEKHLFRRAPVERTHREIVVFTLVNG